MLCLLGPCAVPQTRGETKHATPAAGDSKSNLERAVRMLKDAAKQREVEVQKEIARLKDTSKKQHGGGPAGKGAKGVHKAAAGALAVFGVLAPRGAGRATVCR